jgi:hypothetical protein
MRRGTSEAVDEFVNVVVVSSSSRGISVKLVPTTMPLGRKNLHATPEAFGSLCVYFMCSMRLSPEKNSL